MHGNQFGDWLHSVISDCRYGVRQLRKNPGTTATMAFTLALAIGATTAEKEFTCPTSVPLSAPSSRPRS